MNRLISQAALSCAGVLCAVSLAAAQEIGVAGPAAAQLDSDQHSVFIDKAASVTDRSAAVSALARKAARKGQVRVIVGLQLEMKSDDDLSPAQAATQTATLRVAQSSVAARAGVVADNVTTFDTIPFVSLWVNASQLNALMTDPNVVNVQEDVPAKAGLTVSVPFIKAPQVWAKHFTGNGWAIAVLDTGVQKTHPFLAGKVVSEACYSSNSANTTSLCPGGVAATVAPGSGVNCQATLGSCFHGTHVAGIAAGTSSTRKGVAHQSKIIAIQVFSRQGNETITFDTDWIRGLERVYALRGQFKIAAINMSLGFGRKSAPCDADNPAAATIIKKLRLVKIPTIVASMNNSWNDSVMIPACISAAIAVGSTLRNANTLSPFSNHHPMVRHLAPGSAINSSVPISTYRSLDGTSMATPHVAGAYAVLRDARGGSTIDDIAAALECTGVPVTRAGITEKRIDVLAAYNYLIAPPSVTRSYPFTTDAPGWVANLGGNQWTVSSGYLQVPAGSAGYKIASVFSTCNEGMDITARIGRIWGPGEDGRTGIIFKAQFVGARMSGYFAGYQPNGSFVMFRMDNYDFGSNSGNLLQLCSGTATLDNGSPPLNTFKIVTRGSLHRAYVNGKLICSGTDYAYGTGAVGIAGRFAGNNTGSQLAVDSFVIDPVEVVGTVGP